MLRSSLCDCSDAYIIVKGNITVNNTAAKGAAEYSNNHSKTSGSLWQYCKEIPAVNNEGNIVDFNGANATDSFNFQTKITGQTNNDGVINVEIMAPLKYLSNF